MLWPWSLTVAVLLFVFAAYLILGVVLEKTGGYAPGWRIRCLTCARSRPAAEAGIVRIGARGRKRTLARCSDCGGIRWAVIEPEPEEMGTASPGWTTSEESL